jgi:ABC-type molybdate transport system permease subunit
VIPSDLSPLWISLEASIGATALAFVLGIAAAAAMHRYEGRGRGLLDGILTLPLVLPPTVIGFFCCSDGAALLAKPWNKSVSESLSPGPRP